MNLTFQETAIALAALRMMQEDIEQNGDNARTFTMPHFQDNDCNLPTVAEINNLCDKINE